MSDTPNSPPTCTSHNVASNWSWFALILILAVVAGLRWRFLDTPIERDEGEFAYGGQLILDGEMPYTSFFAMKFPGIYLVFALMEVAFGQTARGIHWGLMIVNLTSIVFVYLLTRRLYDACSAGLAAAAFALMTMSPAIGCTQAQSEHFALLPALVGAWMLSQDAPSLRTLFGAGAAFGVSLLIKQHAGAFALFAIAYVMLSAPSDWLRQPKRQFAELAAILLGISIPLGITSLVFWSQGTWEPFVFWTIRYPQSYISHIPPAEGAANLIKEVRAQLTFTSTIWCAAAVGIILLVKSSNWRFILLWAVASFLAITPGLYFRAHYFIFLAPALAMLAAVGLRPILFGGWSRGGLGKAGAVLVCAAVLGIPALSIAKVMAPKSPEQMFRAMYTGFFVESPLIAGYLAEHTTPEETLAVLGSEPQLFFYAQRKSATGHIYMYPLMENHQYSVEMQNQLISDIERSHPKYIVFCSDPLSWGNQNDTPKPIQKWIESYINSTYYQVARLELFPDQSVAVLWDSEELLMAPRTSTYWTVLCRRAGI